MDSEKFFDDKVFTKKFKEKSGVYIVENPLFTKYLGYPVYKIGYARRSLYTRIGDYRTCYGLVPFKIHAIYCVPEKILNQRVNFANLTERVIQKTALKYGEYTGRGEWYKELPLLLNILFTVREDHKKRFKNAKNWEFYTHQKQGVSLREIELVPEEEIKGTFKDLKAGRHTRSGDNEPNDLEDMNIPDSYIDEEGNDVVR